MSAVTIRGIKANSGERVFKFVPVTTMASGLEMVLPVHILNGAQEGPRLMLTALSHGDAITGLEAIRQVLEKTDPKKLKGTIVALPCQNPVGFEWDSRNTPIDMANMNRSFPGSPKGWFTDQMAAAVSVFCNDADALIDWHGGGYGTAINYLLMKNPDGEIGKKVIDMGYAYGLEYLYSGAPAGPAAAYAGTLTDYMISLGKPAIVAEVGAGMELKIDIVGGSVRGVFNAMKHMGMYPGEPELPKTQWLLRERPLLRPRNGGMFYPECGPEYLNRIVPKGTLLATIRNPLSLEVIEQIHAPCEETVFLDMRGLMTKVHPGDYAYILGNRANAIRKDN